MFKEKDQLRSMANERSKTEGHKNEKIVQLYFKFRNFEISRPKILHQL